MTGSGQFFEAMAAFYLIAGNSYLEMVGPEGGKPRELWNLRPDRMRVVPGGFGVPEAYEYSLKGGDRLWPVDPIAGRTRILHWRSFHPLDDWYGMSAVEAAAFSVDQHNEAGAWNQAMLANRAQPSGMLVYKPTDAKGRGAVLTPEQKARLQSDIDTKLSGSRNTNRALILEGDFDWKQMGLSARDMDWLKGRDVAARDVAIAFGVAPQLVGIPDAATYANMATARLSLWEETIIPFLGRGRDELNNWLTPEFGTDLFLDYDLDEVPALVLRRQAKFETVENASFLTTNEKREAVGFPPVEGGDTILVSATMLPLDFATSPSTGQASGDPDLARKFLTDRSPGSRQREIAVQTRLRAAHERGLTLSMTRELQRVSRAAARAFREGGQAEAVATLDDHAENMERVLRANYLTTMDTFGNRVLAAAKEASPDVQVKAVEDDFAVARDAWIERHAAVRVQAIVDTTKAEILGAIVEGEAAGEGVRQVARRIEEATGGLIGRARAVIISRTETHAAAVAAGDEAAGATGLELRREWIASADDLTRNSHREADGQVVGLREPFQVGGADLARPGDPSGPPGETIGCRCLTPETVVSYVSPMHVTRRRFEGQLVSIKTAGGYELAGTTNHPVLTDAGWKPLHEIVEGDNLVCSDRAEGVRLGDPDVHGADATIGELFNSLQAIAPRCRIAGSSVDFHGERPNHDVDIVAAKGSLRYGDETAFFQAISKFILPRADLAQGALLAACLTSHGHLGLWLAAYSIVSGFSQRQSSIGSHLAHADQHGFATIASAHAGLIKAFVNSFATSEAEVESDGLGRLPVLETTDNLIANHVSPRLAIARDIQIAVSQIFDRCGLAHTDNSGGAFGAKPTLMKIDKVIEVSLRDYSGHVFNLHDPANWYVANGIVTHNCVIGHLTMDEVA